MADSTSATNAQGSGAGTGTSQSDAGQAARGATATAGGGTGELAQLLLAPDIAQSEAYIVNLKRVVAAELDFDAALRDAHKRRVTNAGDFDQQVRNLTLQSMANAQAVAHTLNTAMAYQVTRHQSNEGTYDNGEAHETARTGKVDEQAIFETIIANIAKNPVFSDAIAAAVSAAVSQAMTAAGPTPGPAK